MPIRVNINGVITAAEDARVPILDHGFLFGDSIYETLRTYRRKLFLFDAHFARLEHSAAGIHLTPSWDRARTKAEIVKTIEHAAHGAESRVRLIMTRGVGDLTPDVAACASPTNVVIASPLVELPPEIYAHGVEVIISSLHRNLQFADVKTGNLIRQVLAYREAKAAGAFEAVLLTPDGMISDGITSNMYLVRNGRLLTPSHEAGIVEGITRKVVLNLAREAGLDVVEGVFKAEEISTADEMFLTSTTREVVPITKIGGKLVGTGKPGPATVALLQAYRGAIERLIQED